MKKKHLAFIAVAILLMLDVTFFALDFVPSRIKLSAPIAGGTFPRQLTVQGIAWDRRSDSPHTVTVRAVAEGGRQIAIPVKRDAVRYEGEVHFLLSSFRTVLELPADGAWSVSACLNRNDGTSICSPPRSITVRGGTRSHDFRHFSPTHIAAAAVVLLACIAMALYFSRPRPQILKARVETAIAGLMFSAEATYHVYWYLTGGWSAATALLTHMCGLSILLLIVVFFLDSARLRKYAFELMFFWGLGGALQAVLTPDIGSRGFPEFKYFSFFFTHGLIMVGAVYIIVGRGFRPTLVSILRVTLITNLATAAAYGFNLMLELFPPFQRGNYFVIGYPPPTGSVVDLFARIFGPSPRYLVGLELMGIAVFFLLWAPFAIARALHPARAA